MKNKESEQMGYYRVRKNWNNGKVHKFVHIQIKKKLLLNAPKKELSRDTKYLIRMEKLYIQLFWKKEQKL